MAEAITKMRKYKLEDFPYYLINGEYLYIDT
jgi:hypothetical protein